MVTVVAKTVGFINVVFHTNGKSVGQGIKPFWVVVKHLSNCSSQYSMNRQGLGNVLCYRCRNLEWQPLSIRVDKAICARDHREIFQRVEPENGTDVIVIS